MSNESLVYIIIIIVVCGLFALIIWIGFDYGLRNNITPIGWDNERDGEVDTSIRYKD